ncbi:hypothetical protein GS491_26370 [Rhodococcus hoagii]|nr:hypothetical protein [Prescottella equi]NKR80648.1 hypothetical protein [Prescottella equi]NKS99420.1 hypothetical protein [Prescottella equi]NKS99602.1 hypothetical protein [Prescottella equi]
MIWRDGCAAPATGLLKLGRTLTTLAADHGELPDGSLSAADRAARIEIIDSLSDI